MEKVNEILGVKQISQQLKILLEEKFPYIWIRGEVGSLKYHSSGHIYFALKEDDFVLNAICWKGTPLSIPLEEGALIECYGRITVYGGRSSYQIIAREIRSSGLQGSILAQLEELKKKLSLEGLFDLSKKRAIPAIPEKIAILTSPTGAVLHDILNRIEARFPCCKVCFFPVAVQGVEAVDDILKAMDKIESESFDTIILARGGGSLEDLWIFNDERIVRRVAASKFPIISAIGHETDTTLVDFAADLRAPTPTAAAELCVPDKNEINSRLIMIFESRFKEFSQRLMKYKNLLETYRDFDYIYSNALLLIAQKLDQAVSTFISVVNKRIFAYKIELGKIESPFSLLKKFQSDIDASFMNAVRFSKIRLQENFRAIDAFALFLCEKESEIKGRILVVGSGNKKITTAQELRSAKDFTMKFFDGDVDASVK